MGFNKNGKGIIWDSCLRGISWEHMGISGKKWDIIPTKGKSAGKFNQDLMGFDRWNISNVENPGDHKQFPFADSLNRIMMNGDGLGIVWDPTQSQQCPMDLTNNNRRYMDFII